MKAAENTRASVRLHGNDYVERFRKLPVSRVERLLPYILLSPSDLVADYGCGNGVLLGKIHERIRYYYGVDISEDFIRLAREEAQRKGIRNARFLCMEIVEFCRKNQGRFDKAFTLDFSEHIRDEEFLRIYKAIWSSLKPSGKLYLHTPNGRYFLEKFKEWGLMRQFPEHVAVRDAAKYRELLSVVGFDTVKVRGLPHYLPPMSWFHVLSMLPIAGDCFQARLLIECEK